MKTIILTFFIVFNTSAFAKRLFEKSWCGDTSKVFFYIDGHYENCQRLIADTIYYMKYEAVKDSTDWCIYFDKSMQEKASEFIHLGGDTVYHVYYYRNGQKMEFEKTVGYFDIRKQQWWENGQIKYDNKGMNRENLFHEKAYFSNGKISYRGNYWGGTLWGNAIWYYEDGAVKCVRRFPDYSLETRNREISFVPLETTWFSEKGDTLKNVIADQGYQSFSGVPTAIDTSKIHGAIPYYNVDTDDWHDTKMDRLKDSIYVMTQIADSCYCKAGYIEAGFYIRKDGSITDVVIEPGFEQTVNETFRNSLLRLGHWPPPKKNGKPCDGYYLIYFQMEKAKRK